DDRQTADTVGVVALPGAFELLSGHKRLALVTSCPRRLAEARLRAAGLPIPPVMLTPESWKKGKPDPEPYLLAAKALCVPPSECVALEDSQPGLESALQAGTRVIAVLTSHAPADLPGAAAHVTSLFELPDVFSALGIT